MKKLRSTGLRNAEDLLGEEIAVFEEEKRRQIEADANRHRPFAFVGAV